MAGGELLMSIITAVYVPEGIAMAADSRLTGKKTTHQGIERFPLSDTYQKLILLKNKNIGISACGDSLVNNKTIADFIRLFEINKIHASDDITVIADKLHIELKEINNLNTEFLVCGYHQDIQRVYEVSGAINTSKNDSADTYGAVWRGETEPLIRLLLGENKAKMDFIHASLKDAIDMAEWFVDLTIKYQRFEDGIATCGGPIDVLFITKDDAKFIKHKIYGGINP
jgi:hypothetical protein